MQGRRRGLSLTRCDHSLEFGASLLNLLKLQFPRLVAEPVQQQFENLRRPSIDGSQLARRVCLLGPALRTQPLNLPRAAASLRRASPAALPRFTLHN